MQRKAEKAARSASGLRTHRAARRPRAAGVRDPRPFGPPPSPRGGPSEPPPPIGGPRPARGPRPAGGLVKRPKRAGAPPPSTKPSPAPEAPPAVVPPAAAVWADLSLTRAVAKPPVTVPAKEWATARTAETKAVEAKAPPGVPTPPLKSGVGRMAAEAAAAEASSASASAWAVATAALPSSSEGGGGGGAPPLARRAGARSRRISPE